MNELFSRYVRWGRDALEYSLKPLGKICAATGSPLSPGTVCRCVLVEQNGQTLRLDYRHDAWPGPVPNQLAVWKTVVPPPLNPDAVHLDSDRLLELLEEPVPEFSDDLHEPQHDQQELPGYSEAEAIRYVAALFLLQRRKLKLDDAVSQQGVETLRLLGSRGEGPFELVNLRLKDEEIHAIIQKLKQRLATEVST